MHSVITDDISHKQILLAEGHWQGVSLGLRGNGKLEFSVGEAPPAYSGSKPISPNRPLHVGAICDGQQLHLYVDGKRQVSKPLTKPINLARLPLLLGASPKPDGAGAFFHGVLDEIRISNTARYTADFTPPSPQERFAPDKDTIALYHCDVGSGNVLTDSSGNGHHGKIVGAKWVRVGSGQPTDEAATPYDLLTSDDYEWTKPENLGPIVNGPDYDASPALSADGLTLLMRSSRPGLGKNDLWMCRRSTPDAPWSPPENLGPTVNSSVQEESPALAADGLLLLFTSERDQADGQMRLWATTRNTPTSPWSPPAVLPFSGIPQGAKDFNVGVSADGLQLIFESFGRPGGVGREDLWEVRRQSADGPWGTPRNLPSINSESRDLTPALSSDGRVLLFSSDRPGGRGGNDLWMSTRSSPAAAWSTPKLLDGPINAATDELAPCLSADGKTLLFHSWRAGGQGQADLWMSRRVRKPLAPEADPPTMPMLSARLRVMLPDSLTSHIALSPDGKLLAARNRRARKLKLWNLQTREVEHTWDVAPNAMGALSFIPGQSSLVVGEDNAAVTFNTQTGERASSSTPEGGSIESIAVSPDGRYMALSRGAPDGSVQLRDLTSRDPLTTVATHQPFRASCVAFNHDGTRLASGGLDKRVRIYDLAAAKEILTLDAGHLVHAVAFSPDGRSIACGDRGPNIDAKDTGSVQLWDAATGQRFKQFTGFTYIVGDVAFSPDRRLLAAAQELGTGPVQVFDLLAGGKPLIIEEANAWRVEFLPTGHTLVTAGEKAGVQLWEIDVPEVEVSTATFTAPDIERGITPLSIADRAFRVEEVQGKPVIRLSDPKNPDLIFALDDAVAFDVPADSTDRFVLRATLLDEAADSPSRFISVGFDSHQPNGNSRVFHMVEPFVRVAGTGKWIELEWELPHARLANHITGGADFMLHFYSRPVHQVTLTRIRAKPRNATVAAGVGAIDLLAISDPVTDRGYGSWQRTPEGFIGAGTGTDKLNPPIEFTGSYDLQVTLRASHASGQAAVGFPVGPAHATLVCQQLQENTLVTGLDIVEGQGWSNPQNPTRAERKGVDPSKPHTFDIRVRVTGEQARIAVELDGQPLSTWEGPTAALATHPRWIVRENRLMLGVAADEPSKSAVFQRLFLRPMGAAVKHLRPAGPTTFINALGMQFVRVPAGKSWLGGGGGKPGTREVEFKDDFYLGKYEVTQAEWLAVMGTNPSWFSRGKDWTAADDFAEADLNRFPVESASWEDAQQFVQRLNEKASDTGWVYRLPTKDESEYACRGGPLAKPEDSAFDYYLDQPMNTLPPDRANVNESNLKRPCPVGSYAPNRLGLHDMHGNVREWCADEHTVLYNGKPGRANRMGGWTTGASACRAAQGYGEIPTYKQYDLGLRVVRVPAAGSWQPMFNGKDLTGWSVPASVTGKAEVRVEDRQPLLHLTPPIHLPAKIAFGDYHLRFECRSEKFAGIHLFGSPEGRLSCELSTTASDLHIMGVNFTWQKAEVRGGRFIGDGMTVGGNKTTALSSIAIDPKNPWQSVEVIRLGDSFAVLINGRIAGAITNVRRVRDGRDELPGRSGVVLLAYSGQADYRNIEIRQINALPPEIRELAAWQPLFNGKDLSGWELDSGTIEDWRVDNGVLVRLGGSIGQWLRTKQSFRDFTLRLETRSPASANSGIALRQSDTGGNCACRHERHHRRPSHSARKGAVPAARRHRSLEAERMEPVGNHLPRQVHHRVD